MGGSIRIVYGDPQTTPKYSDPTPTFLSSSLPINYIPPKGHIIALAERIIECESSGNPLAQNPSSTAKGLFQFLDGTFKYYGLKLWGSMEDKSALNAKDNYELGIWVLENYGSGDWSESQSCWTK